MLTKTIKNHRCRLIRTAKGQPVVESVIKKLTRESEEILSERERRMSSFIADSMAMNNSANEDEKHEDYIEVFDWFKSSYLSRK